MVEEGRTVGYIRKYIVHNKFKNIANNDKLTDKEIRGIVAKLEEEQSKGVFKELNDFVSCDIVLKLYILISIIEFVCKSHNLSPTYNIICPSVQ